MKHIYIDSETKGDVSTMKLRDFEKAKTHGTHEDFCKKQWPHSLRNSRQLQKSASNWFRANQGGEPPFSCDLGKPLIQVHKDLDKEALATIFIACNYSKIRVTLRHPSSGGCGLWICSSFTGCSLDRNWTVSKECTTGRDHHPEVTKRNVSSAKKVFRFTLHSGLTLSVAESICPR